MLSVVRPWLQALPVRMQAVLLLSLRGPDGCTKENLAKVLTRELRFVILFPAFPKGEHEKKGDDFMGFQKGVTDWNIVQQFVESHDEYPHHWVMHFAHAAEIIGQFHPDDEIRTFWWNVYQEIVRALHLNPEDLLQLSARLRRSSWEQSQMPADGYQYLTVTFAVPNDDVDSFVGWLHTEVQAGNAVRSDNQKVSIAVESHFSEE